MKPSWNNIGDGGFLIFGLQSNDLTMFSIPLGAGALLFLFAGWKFFRRRNYPALVLCLPYVILLITGAFVCARSSQGGQAREVSLGEMQRLKNLNINEFSAIVINSNVTFGDGFQCAGGIVSGRHDNQTVNAILEHNQLTRPENMALIWLLDSRASRASLSKDLLFLRDQRRSDKGIWIGWIAEREINEVRRMDGSNL